MGHPEGRASYIPDRKGKGQSDFSDWPLLMPATTGVPGEPGFGSLGWSDLLSHTLSRAVQSAHGLT